MATKIKLTITLLGDFHIGTGAGRGRATDAVVVTDENQAPFIPGSTIKGLCKWQACRLIDSFPGLGPKPEIIDEDERTHSRDYIGPAFEIFGGGSNAKDAEDRVCFDHAVTMDIVDMTRSGRSARDRVSGRARDKHLFFCEDAGPATFTTTLTCHDDLSPNAIILLILSLRRMEAIGGQRRRGKGRCQCQVEIIDPGKGETRSMLKGLILPPRAADTAEKFRTFAEPLLADAKTKKQLATRQVATSASNDPSASSQQSPASPPASTKTCWLVYATAKSPLTLGHDQAADNTIQSENFISGTRWRGALAWRAIREGMNPESELFQDVFVRERVQFGPLFPAAKKWEHAGTFPMPVPASFCTCKRLPGAKEDATIEVHGVADRMWHASQECDYCRAPTQPAEGYVQLVGDSRAANVQLGLPPMHVFQRTAIDEETQRGADAQLFALESVQQGRRLAGYLWGEQDLLEAAFGSLCDSWTTIRIGKAKSRGQGVVGIVLKRTNHAHTCFPNLLSPDISEPDANAKPPATSPFFLTLYSDLIAFDHYLRPVTTLTPNALWRLLGQTDDSPPFKCPQGFVNTRRIGGFLGGQVGLPRTADVAIAAGSTWKFYWKDMASEGDRERVWRMLKSAQATGIGLRRGEGYGRIILNHPLHLARWESTQTSSKPMAISPVDFTADEELPTRAGAKRTRQRLQLYARPADFEGTYQRLFDELAQEENPLEAVQRLFDDQFHRSEKAKNLVAVLKKLVGDKLQLFEERGGKTVCIARTLASDKKAVVRFRRELERQSREVFDHD